MAYPCVSLHNKGFGSSAVKTLRVLRPSGGLTLLYCSGSVAFREGWEDISGANVEEGWENISRGGCANRPTCMVCLHSKDLGSSAEHNRACDETSSALVCGYTCAQGCAPQSIDIQILK